MKTFSNLLVVLCICISQLVLAQAPQGFSYQAVARDINDNIIKDEFISMRFWVLADNTAGTPIYRETHTGVYTGVNGVITRVIGSGTADVGSFSTIDWGAKNYFIRVDMDTKGGSDFIQMGTSQLLSVPYAMFAQKSGSGGASFSAGNGISISNNVITNTGDNDNSTTNELQQISISGTVLTLSNNGGSVTLPSSGGGGDNWGTQSAATDGTSISGNGTPSSPIKLNNQNASNGQVLKSNGSAWVPGTDNDSQNLSISGNNLSIANGNTVSLPSDGDGSSTNEIQSLSLNGNALSLSSSNTVNLPANNDNDSSNELQNLSSSKSSSDVTVNISSGTSTTFSVNDNDSSPTNEIQSLSVSGTSLSLSGSNTVTLPNGLWNKNAQFFGIHYLNEVSIGTQSVFGELNVNGRGVFFNESSPTARTTINSNGTMVLTGDTNTKMNIGTSDRGRLELFNEDGKRTILLDRNTSTGGSFIGLNNKFTPSQTVILSTRDDDGVGEIFTFAASKPIAGFTHLDGNPDKGFVGVISPANEFRAGMFINTSNQGVLFADVKNFRMDYPGRSEKEIWYASLEGPEAAAYERGTATLENGEAFIPFSDHFGLVIIEKGMTVMLTPLDGGSLGLAVIQKTKTGFRVKELHGGQGNYSFDWEAKGVRAGFERYEAVRDKSEAQPAALEVRN